MKILYANGTMLYFPPPSKWLRATTIPSQARPGWFLIVPDADPSKHLSMLPEGYFEPKNSVNDGPYEQCFPLERYNALLFQPTNDGHDVLVMYVEIP